MNYVSFLTAHLEYLLARGADYTNGENPMNTKERIRHLAEQDGLTLEEAEDFAVAVRSKRIMDVSSGREFEVAASSLRKDSLLESELGIRISPVKNRIDDIERAMLPKVGRTAVYDAENRSVVYGNSTYTHFDKYTLTEEEILKAGVQVDRDPSILPSSMSNNGTFVAVVTIDGWEAFYSKSELDKLNHLEIYKRQNLMGRPQILSKEDYRDLARAADLGYFTLMHRGIKAQTLPEARKYFYNFTEADAPYLGEGVFGWGTYCSDDLSVAMTYAGSKEYSFVMSFWVPRDSVVASVVRSDTYRFRSDIMRSYPEMASGYSPSPYPPTFQPAGGAAAEGYDMLVTAPNIALLLNRNIAVMDQINFINKTGPDFEAVRKIRQGENAV